MKNLINLLKSAARTADRNQEEPVILSYRREEGTHGKTDIIIKGPDPAVYAGLAALVTKTVRTMPKEMQEPTLELLYSHVRHELRQE
jgi:hypothetical protein